MAEAIAAARERKPGEERENGGESTEKCCWKLSG